MEPRSGAPSAPEQGTAPGRATESEPLQVTVERIVSGGQTGVDRAALDVARRLGIAHGGWCPRGRWAEDGVIPEHYHLQETPGHACEERTEWNVRDADATVIFSISTELTGGSAYTRWVAQQLGKPWLHLARASCPVEEAARRLREFLRHTQVRVLNVAGPRASTEPEAAQYAASVLEQVFGTPGLGPCSTLQLPGTAPDRSQPASSCLRGEAPSAAHLLGSNQPNHPAHGQNAAQEGAVGRAVPLQPPGQRNEG